MRFFLYSILFVFGHFQGFAQSIDTISIKIKDIDTYISQISKLCKDSDSLCSESTWNGFAAATNRFGLPAKNNKGGSCFRTSLFYHDQIFFYNELFDFKINEGKWQILQSYYFIDNSLIKYEKVDSIIYENNNKSKLNHRIVLYFDHKELIKKELYVYDKYNVDKEEIDRIIEFSDSFTKLIIR